MLIELKIQSRIKFVKDLEQERKTVGMQIEREGGMEAERGGEKEGERGMICGGRRGEIDAFRWWRGVLEGKREGRKRRKGSGGGKGGREQGG